MSAVKVDYKFGGVDVSVSRRDDDDELLDAEWIRLWTKKEPYVQSIPATNFFLYKRDVGYQWEITEVLDDGDELTWCIVENRGQCRRMVAKLTGVVFAD